MSESAAMKKMIKARAALILDQRFYGHLALKLNLVENLNTRRMSTDGISLNFNPNFVENISMDNCKTIICEEVMHCSFQHHTRRGNRLHEDWNRACDYVINIILKDSGFKLEKDSLYDPSFKDKSVDEVYHILQGRKPKQQQGGGSGNSQGQNQQQESPNNSQGDQQNQQQGQGKGKADKPSTGQSSDPGGCGEVQDFPGETGEATESELQQQAQEWKIATAAAASQAASCGQLPGSLKEVIEDMLATKVPWREVLQRFVEQVSRNDYTYTRTNPRYATFGIVMPSLYNKELPPIDVWIDTSGSISNKDLQQFVSEINDIRGHYRTTIRIIQCDTDVRFTSVIEPDDEFIKLELHGRGGTAFSPAIAWSMKQEELPCCGIYLTDMDCSNFGKEPDFPVLWVQTEGRRAVKVPFGEVILMTN